MCSCNNKTPGTRPPLPLARLMFYDGQELRAKDLNTLQSVTEERRRWHVRALHAAFGIAYGLEATDQGVGKKKKGTELVRVLPGLAYDCTGRLLVLKAPHDFPVPDGVPDAVESCLLLLRFLPDSDSSCCSLPVRCCLGEPLRCREAVEFVWKDSAAATPRDGVPLARIQFQAGAKGRIAQLDDTFVPFLTRGVQRPHLVADRTIAGSTPWQTGPASLIIANQPKRDIDLVPIDVSIDTSAAGFTCIPCYFATLSGSVIDEAAKRWLPILFPHITSEQLDSFIFRFWVPLNRFFPSHTGAFIGRDFNEFRNFANQLRLYVSWYGLEGDCSAIPIPPLKFVQILCSCGQASRIA